MIGNDVVDILQSRVESNWRRHGFIQKIFTADEQVLIANAPEPEIMVWLLWSMKEAAYKIYNRKTRVRQYMPQKLQCTILSQKNNYYTGQVACFEHVYYTKTVFENNALHTVAVICNDNLAYVTEIKNNGIIKDGSGIPYLRTGSKNILQDVSISHHGRFEKVVRINKTSA